MFDIETTKKAIKHFKNMKEKNLVVLNDFREEIEMKKSIGNDNINYSTLTYENRDKYYSVAIETLETKIKIRPIKITNKNDVRIGNITFKKGTTGYKCPVCGRIIIYGDKYCKDCGQAILWEMED